MDSITWFNKKVPKIGEVARYLVFDVPTLTIRVESAKYIGDTHLTYKKRRVLAHIIQKSIGTDWVDLHGLPYQIQRSEYKLLRL